MFIDDLKETLNEEPAITENGAIGYRTTGKALLDINFAVSSMRNMNEQQIIDKFIKAFYEDKILAIKWLFYARDIRQGIGERRLFRVCMKYLAEHHKDIVKGIIPLIPEYGRYDDLWRLLDTELSDDVINLIKYQIDRDIENMHNNKPISLLAKWLPSINASSKETKKLAYIIMFNLGYTERQYRKLLSELRGYSNIVERMMCNNEWNKINYSIVPSRANLIYGKAFLRNDEERRQNYLNSLQKGEVKINASTLFPHDIIHKYGRSNNDIIELEEMWKSLPDYVQSNENTICVADGSGSMTSHIGNTKITALDVANSLAIYFAERSSGQFKDKYITFSENPQIVDFSNTKSLREKIEITRCYNEVANTNIEGVFDLILKTAIDKNMRQEDLPDNILILSDMEFDSCAYCNDDKKCDKKLFELFSERYEEYGYKLPRLVFWNINSRTRTIPVKENELGVALVSGFSPAIINMVLSNHTDPLECLLEQINSERYESIENILKLSL